MRKCVWKSCFNPWIMNNVTWINSLSTAIIKRDFADILRCFLLSGGSASIILEPMMFNDNKYQEVFKGLLASPNLSLTEKLL